MAFDGIITRAVVRELRDVLVDGRIDKIYEPEPDSIVLNIRASEPLRLFASCHSAGASVRLIRTNPENPKEPYPFCMLLRKHIQGSRIVSVEQRGSERIIELTLERLNELGLMVTKKLIFEIMGKYSNIILVDMSRRTAKPGHEASSEKKDPMLYSSPAHEDAPEQRDSWLYSPSAGVFDGASGCLILGSIKGVPSGLSRVREILPGRLYEYPPLQDKIPFDKAEPCDLDDPRGILSRIGGISPSVADELAELGSGEERKALIDVSLHIKPGEFVSTRCASSRACMKTITVLRVSSTSCGCRNTRDQMSSHSAHCQTAWITISSTASRRAGSHSGRTS